MPQTPEVNHNNTLRRTSLARWGAVLLLLAATLAAAPMSAEKGKPLAVKDVTDLLEGSVPSSEIARIVNENGISFRMSDGLASQFRAAGATDELIDALRRAPAPEEQPTPPPAPVTGILQVQSQPGEAQVFVNDEPRGTTSTSGDLKLAGLAPGSYRLRLVLSGYKTWENSLSVPAGGTATAFVTLEKETLIPTVTLDADKTSVTAGQNVYLRWTSSNATDLDIEPGVGKVALSGATSVSPNQSTTYTVTAIGPGGIKTATTFVSVTPAPLAPTPVITSVVGDMPNFPIPGASFKAMRFYESGFDATPLKNRTYNTQFDHRTSHFINWELRLNCPAVVRRTDFTMYATWYDPSGKVYANQTLDTWALPGWTEPVYNLGRGSQRVGMWKRGTYRVDLTVNGARIASGSFTIY
jgi:hypothetical protein